MTFEHIIDEMPWVYPHSENGGQLHIGKNGHIDPTETPKTVLFLMRETLQRSSIMNICAWEIQAEERDSRNWN